MRKGLFMRLLAYIFVFLILALGLVIGLTAAGGTPDAFEFIRSLM